MKTLVILGFVQTACILLLLVIVLGEDDAAPSVTTQAAPALLVSNPSPSTPASPQHTDEERLRQIIREELAALELAATPARQPARSAIELREQRMYVSDRIDYYSSVGEISAIEMNELQREIAVLDEAGRKEMLSKLARAMNAQQIKSQL